LLLKADTHKLFFTFDRKNAISPAGHAIIQAQLIQLAFREKGRGSYLYPKPCLADRVSGPHFFIVSEKGGNYLWIFGVEWGKIQRI